MFYMKEIQINEDFIALKKGFIKKTAVTLAVSALVLSVTVFYFFIEVRTSFTLISGVASVLCISKLLSCFIKLNAWMYRAIAAVVSLFCGCHFYYILTMHLSETVYAVPRFVSNFAAENPGSPWMIIVIGIYFIYAAVIFGLSLFVRYIYKKLKKMMESAAE